MNEFELMAEADHRAHAYLAGVTTRRAYPDDHAIAALSAFAEPLPDSGDAGQTLRLLDELGSPATVVSNGPNYYGFVIGATLPAAAAAAPSCHRFAGQSPGPASRPAAPNEETAVSSGTGTRAST